MRFVEPHAGWQSGRLSQAEAAWLLGLHVKARVHRYDDKRMAIFHGPRKLATPDRDGNLNKVANGDNYARKRHGARIG